MKHVTAWGLALSLGLFASVGCDDAKNKAKDAAKDAKGALSDVEKKAKEEADKATADAKNLVVDPIKKMFPQFEEKIKAMTGATATGATEKLAALKKLVEEFTAAPADKMGDVKTKLLAAFEELKKMVGL